MAKKIRPLGDRVIVEAMTQETSKSGIIIPDTAKEKPQKGKGNDPKSPHQNACPMPM